MNEINSDFQKEPSKLKYYEIQIGESYILNAKKILVSVDFG